MLYDSEKTKVTYDFKVSLREEEGFVAEKGYTQVGFWNANRFILVDLGDGSTDVITV